MTTNKVAKTGRTISFQAMIQSRMLTAVRVSVNPSADEFWGQGTHPRHRADGRLGEVVEEGTAGQGDRP